MDINDLDISPELRAKVAACKTPEEILAIAKKEGVKLSEEQLESISGGAKWNWSGGYYTECPRCGKTVDVDDKDNPPASCPYCGAPFYWN